MRDAAHRSVYRRGVPKSMARGCKGPVVSASEEQSHGKTRTSRGLLVLAVATPLVTAVVGGVLAWRAYVRFVTEGVAASDPAAGEGAPLVVVVGRTPGGPGEWVAYATAFARVQDALGERLVVRYTADSADLERSLSSGEAALGLVPVGSYLRLADAGVVTLVAAPVIDGQTRDAAALVVAATSSVTRLEQLEGARAVVRPRTLSGEKYAYWLLGRRGTEPGAFFGSLLDADSQDDALKKVADGAADAAFVRRSSLAAWPDGSFRVIAVSPEFGAPPVVARTSLDPDIVRRVRETLVNIDARTDLPGSSVLDGFIPVSDDDYAFARVLNATTSGSGNAGDAQ
jgi:phosphonate transport system substrate-binding protein